jgi:hypothetical protein
MIMDRWRDVTALNRVGPSSRAWVMSKVQRLANRLKVSRVGVPVP